MKPSTRPTTALGALLLAGSTATGCAPSTSDNRATEDRTSGTPRVWLFQEVDNEPKAAIVDEAVEAFTGRHEGVEVDVRHIPVDSRTERMKAAFNDPSSAPDLVEYGTTDTAGLVRDGGLADVTAESDGWKEARDTDTPDRGGVMAASTVMTVPVLVFFVLVQRRLVSGLGGAVKD